MSNYYNLTSFNALINEVLKSINNKVRCTIFINSTMINGKEQLHKFFNIFPVKEKPTLNDIIHLYFTDVVVSLEDREKQINQFKADILKFLITNEEVRGLLNDTNL